jgi:hypothetical protein
VQRKQEERYGAGGRDFFFHDAQQASQEKTRGCTVLADEVERQIEGAVLRVRQTLVRRLKHKKNNLLSTQPGKRPNTTSRITAA